MKIISVSDATFFRDLLSATSLPCGLSTAEVLAATARFKLSADTHASAPDSERTGFSACDDANIVRGNSAGSRSGGCRIDPCVSAIGGWPETFALSFPQGTAAETEPDSQMVDVALAPSGKAVPQFASELDPTTACKVAASWDFAAAADASSDAGEHDEYARVRSRVAAHVLM